MFKTVLKTDPKSTFYLSLQERFNRTGTLSENQFQILQGKDVDIRTRKKRQPFLRKKSEKIIVDRGKQPTPGPIYKKDQEVGTLLEYLLQRYPGHKTANHFKNKYELNMLSQKDVAEIRRMANCHKVISPIRTHPG